MRIKVYKSLDRSIQFFGIRGRFIIPMAAGAGLSILISVAVGNVTSGLVGLMLFFILFFSCAMAVIGIQNAVGEKELFCRIAMYRCPDYIRVKPGKTIRKWK